MPRSIALDAAQEASRDRLVADGRHGSPDEAIAAVLTLLRREDRLATLREAWRAGVASGDYAPLDTALDGLMEDYPVRAMTCP